MTSSIKIVLAAAFVAVAWGLSFLFIDRSLTVVGPFGVALARTALGAAVLHLLPGAWRRIPLRDHGPLLLAIVWMAAPMVLFPLAQQHLSSAVAGMINGSAPLWTAVIAAAVAHRLPGGRRVAGLALGFAGVCVIALSSSRSSADESSLVGVLLVLLATICYGIAFNLTGPLQRRHGALPVIARVMAIAVILEAPAGLPQVLAPTPNQVGLMSLGALGMVSTGAAFAIFTWLTGQTDATNASLVTYAVPAIAVMAGAAAGEDIAVLALGGVPFVIVGAYLCQHPRRSTRNTGQQAVQQLTGGAH